MVGRGGKDRGIKIRGKKRRLVLCPNKNRMGFCNPFRNHRHARQHEMLDPRNTVSATVHERMPHPMPIQCRGRNRGKESPFAWPKGMIRCR